VKVNSLRKYHQVLEEVKSIVACGRVTQVLGLVIEAEGPALKVGDLCQIKASYKEILAEVSGFRKDRLLLTPLGETLGIEPGDRVYACGAPEAKVGRELLGRVVNALGEPIDGRPLSFMRKSYSLYNEPLKPFERERIKEPLDVGIRAINALLTLGKGQRMAIMAGSGVGKSTLLGMMARHTKAEVNVIALIGERGREVREFIERDLGEEGLKR